MCMLGVVLEHDFLRPALRNVQEASPPSASGGMYAQGNRGFLFRNSAGTHGMRRWFYVHNVANRNLQHDERQPEHRRRASDGRHDPSLRDPGHSCITVAGRFRPIARLDAHQTHGS